MYVITTAKEKAEILFFHHGFETANQYCNLELDTINKENEKEVDFWLDVKNYLILLKK